MHNPESSSHLDHSTLVEFSYNNENFYLTDNYEDISTVDGNYISDPSLSVVLPVNSVGGLDKVLATVTVSTEPYLFPVLLTAGRKAARTEVVVKEMVDGSVKTLFRGSVASAIRNPGGKTDITKIMVKNQKSDLQRSLGFSCNASCAWVFGEANTCKVDVESHKEAVTIQVEDKNRPEIKVTSTISDDREEKWRDGYIRKDGVKVKIREVDFSDTSNKKIYLFNLPPSTWLEGTPTVDLLPGCAKTKNSCMFWENTERFSGVGIVALSYNPIFENPNI